MSLGWPRESFTYDGCCTHFSINEQIVGRTENMPADEINRIDAERKIVKQRLYIANTGPGVYAATNRAHGEPPPPPGKNSDTNTLSATSPSGPMASCWSTRSAPFF
jgi:hypothetical protein